MRPSLLVCIGMMWCVLIFYGMLFSADIKYVNVAYWDSGGPRPSVLFYYSRMPATNVWVDIAFWPLGRLLEITGYWEFTGEPP